jgi:hypothetical protein
LSLLVSHWRASSYVQRPEKVSTQHHSARARFFSTTAELRSEVAGCRIRTWHLMPTERMDPPPGALPPMRMTASWSGSNHPAAYKFVARRCAPMASSPRILCRPAPPEPEAMQKAPSQFIVAARAQASRRCETQAALSGKPLALLQFQSLDPFRAYREPDRRRRDEERGFLAPNKEPPTNQKHDLTGKTPYRFESSSLQRRVRSEPCVPDTWRPGFTAIGWL